MRRAPLGEAAFRHALIASGVVLAIALGAGAVRLLPWLLSREVPLRVSLPFAEALAAVALETAVLVGLPTGFALAAARMVDRGEARALLALGASPLRIAGGALVHGAALAAFALALALAQGSRASMPGRFARDLVEQGHASCAGAKTPKTALVPMVGVTWLCFPGEAPRVVGTLPGFGERAWFSATELSPSDDLRSFALSDLRIVTQKSESFPELRLSVKSARIAGLAPWGRPAKLGAVPRALLVALSALVAALAAAFVVVTRARESRVAALAIGGASALAMLQTLHAIDKSDLATTAYAFVPIAGLTALAVAAAVDLGIARAISRVRRSRGA